MKEIEFKKNSWHFKIVDTFFDHIEFTDLCKYIRYFLYSLCIGAVASTVLLIMAFVLVSPILNVLFVVFGFDVFSGNVDLRNIFTAFVIAGAALYFVVYVNTRDKINAWYYEKFKGVDYQEHVDMKKLRKLAKNVVSEKEPGILSYAWKTIKDKTCFKVRFVK